MQLRDSGMPKDAVLDVFEGGGLLLAVFFLSIYPCSSIIQQCFGLE
jgi:hypothetical protein